MTENVNQVVESFIRMTEKIANGRTNVLDFGSPDMTFYRGEIHIIKMIGDHPNIYISEIARRFGITRAVISKTIMKLEKRGIVQKSQFGEDKKKRALTLTDKGRAAYDAHVQYHHEQDEPFFHFLHKLPPNELKIIKCFLDKAHELIENHF